MELPLITRRLALRWPIESDFQTLVELWTDPRVARFMDDFGPRDEQAVREWLDLHSSDTTRNGTHLQLILTRRTDATPVGWLGLGVSNDPTADWSFGYAIHPAHRSNGYATEALAAALTHLDVTVWGECHLTNNASAHVMQSAGMQELPPTTSRRFLHPPTREQTAPTPAAEQSEGVHEERSGAW